jgi:tetratricopeptide (TPR) repeat protein
MPGNASFVYCILGNTYRKLGGFSKAIVYHKELLAIAKEVGNRSGGVTTYGNLCIAYERLGNFSKAIKYHDQDLVIAKEVDDRAGKAEHTGTSGLCISR